MLQLFPTVLAASTVKSVGVVIAVLVDRSASSGTSSSTSAPAAPSRLGDRARAQPQAVLRRRGLEGPQPRPRARAGLVLLGRRRRRPAALLARRAGPAGGRHRDVRRHLRQPRRAPVRDHRGGRLQLRRLPRRRGRRRRRAAFTLTDADGEFVATVNWQAPALNTVLLRFSEEEVQRHPHLRPARHADAGVGRRRRRSAHRPADRGAHRLPRVDPAHLRGGARPRPRRRCARSSASTTDDADRLHGPGRRRGRCSTSASTTRRRPAAPTRAPAATPRARRS